MKNTLLKLIFFGFFGFLSAQEIQVTMAAGIDTTNNFNKKEVFALWENYLTAISLETNPDIYWNQQEKEIFKSYDLLDNAGYLTPSLYGLVKEGGKNVVLSIAPYGEFYEIKSIFYYTYPDETIYPLAIVKYYAAMEEGIYKLYNHLPVYASHWPTKKVGYFNYVYHPNHPFDSFKAEAANAFYVKIAEVFDLSLSEFKYYIAENCDKIFNLQGFDFIIGMGKDNNLCGFYDDKNNIIYSNSITGENYTHEIAHSILEKFPNSGVFHLGIVTYLGEETHFNKSLIFHIRRISDYLEKHPEINLNNFVEEFSSMDEFTSPQYIIPAMICHLALEKGGVESLKKLFSYGNVNTYEAIEEVVGVKRKNLNVYLRNKIKFYSENGIECLL